MKKILTALFFLVLVLLLVWLWKGKVSKPVTWTDDQPAVEVSNTTREKPAPRVTAGPAVEVKSDENGVIITKIGDQKVYKVVSRKPVKRLDVRNGLMSFWEVDEEAGTLKYKTVNVNEFMEKGS